VSLFDSVEKFSMLWLLVPVVVVVIGIAVALIVCYMRKKRHRGQTRKNIHLICYLSVF